jgi:uncharacterized protein YndB with AHSA1/START domain
MNGKLETIDDRPALRFERRLDHPIERVWRAVTDPDELRHWFPPGEDLQITESEPPYLLVGSWYGDTLRFELRPDGEDCVLVFTHSFAERDKAARDAAGWDRCFARLDALLASEPMSEADSLASWPETHERSAQSFGVDPSLAAKRLPNTAPSSEPGRASAPVSDSIPTHRGALYYVPPR